MKLSKAQTKTHQMALDLVHSDKALTWEERLFIIENYHEGATHLNGTQGAFFTPYRLALDFSIDAGGGERAIDLCAGIGALSFALQDKVEELVCIEINEEYFEVGRRVMPQAQWINANIFEVDYMALGNFELAYSNPPFGNVATAKVWSGHYTGADMVYKTIELASRIARYGAFIVPQGLAPFQFSGKPYPRNVENAHYEKFREQTGIELNFGCGIDTSYHLDDWKGVKPMCEIVTCEFENRAAVPGYQGGLFSQAA